MLLLIDASRANNEQKTGVEWYAYFVIQELKKIVPPEVRVILYAREALKGELAKLPANWSERVLKWPPRRFWTQIRLSFEMFKYRRRQDVILFVPAHVLPLITPLKVFTTIHDLGGFSFPRGYSWFEKRYTKFAVRLALKRATIFVPSDFIKKEIEYFFKDKQLAAKSGQEKEIKVIANAYDKNSFQQINDQEKIRSVLEKYHLQPPYFLSIGRLEEKKNTAGIIRGFNLFRQSVDGRQPIKQNFKLVLLGKAGYGYGRVRQTFEESKYKDSVILPGWVEQEDIPFLMAGASAFVFPSFYEGFGIPVLEALAAGVPVIASASSSLPEVSGGAALLINPCKPSEIAAALSEIVSNKELREDLVAKGLLWVKNFSWERTAREIWQIFDLR